MTMLLCFTLAMFLAFGIYLIQEAIWLYLLATGLGIQSWLLRWAPGWLFRLWARLLIVYCKWRENRVVQ